MKSKMAAIALYYTKFECMVTPKFYESNLWVCILKRYIQNISKIKSQEHVLISINVLYQWSKPQ